MRALHVPAAGEPPQLSELPMPEVQDGHVLIKVTAAGLNPVDHAIAAGMLAAMMPHEYPVVLGRDGSGIVVEVGAGVDHVVVGDSVFGHVLLAPPVHAGTLAEYALLSGAAVATKPVDLDFVPAAAIPLAGAAAVATVDAIDSRPGQVVLVNGANGGVGSFAVQLLAARDAVVVATGLAADADRLSGLGASMVVDYTGADVAEQVLAAYPDGVDALIELAAYSPETSPLAAVRAGGRVSSSTNAADAEVLAAVGLSGTNIMAQPVRDVIAALAEQVAGGTLKADVTTVLTLDQAADGLTGLADGTTHGKIVVAVGD